MVTRSRLYKSLAALTVVAAPTPVLATTYNFVTFSDPDYASTTATGINNAGQVVGTVTTSTGASSGFIYNPTTTSFTILNEPLASPGETFADGINNSGQVIGTYVSATTFIGGVTNYRPFIYNQATSTYTPLSENLSFAEGLNDHNQFVGRGEMTFELTPTNEAFVETITTGPRNVLGDPSLHGITETAAGINNNGLVVGTYRLVQGGIAFVGDRGYLYDTLTNTYTSVSDPAASLGLYPDTELLGINNAGLVLGQYDQGPGTTIPGSQFLYDTISGTFTDISSPGTISGLNDSGQIVGYYATAFDANGRATAEASFVGTPIAQSTVPEPPSLVLLGVGMLGGWLVQRPTRAKRRATV